MNKELEILKLQNRVTRMRGRTGKENKSIRQQCLRKTKQLQGQ